MEQIKQEGEGLGMRGIPRRVRKASDYGYEVYNEFPVTVNRKSSDFNIYLFGPILETTQFISALEAFRMAGPDDEVHIHLSTPGGLMDATDTFLSAMHQCDGRVIVHASGGCHSCGSIILLHANEFTLSENFNMLIHNGSTGSWGDLNKFAASAKHSVEYMNKVMRNTYEGFLTPEELQAMLDGKDFWMGPEEFMERHAKRQAVFMKKMEQQKLRQLQLESEPTPAPRPRATRKKQQPA